jgi:hypothetical protein
MFTETAIACPNCRDCLISCTGLYRYATRSLQLLVTVTSLFTQRWPLQALGGLRDHCVLCCTTASLSFAATHLELYPEIGEEVQHGCTLCSCMAPGARHFMSRCKTCMGPQMIIVQDPTGMDT